MHMKILSTLHDMPLTRMVCGLALAFPVGIAHSSEQYISFRSTAYINDNTVRLRDVADLGPLPDTWRQLAGDIAVAKLHRHEKRIDLRATRLAEAARRQLPALTPWLRPDEIQKVTIIMREESASRAADSRPDATKSTRCLELTRGLARGDALSAASVRPVVCQRGRPIQSVHYDRSAQLARATHDLARGDTLAAIAPQRFAKIRQGENVTTVVRSGAITVTRTGASLTDTAPGRSAILATGSGDFLTVPVHVQPVR
jgi:flagella basal body P-ring formation protein FlgA